jgi:6-phosphogluconate dehydrogenase
MVHAGIEYGILAAYAEGFQILERANVGNGRRLGNGAPPLRHPERIFGQRRGRHVEQP